MARQINLIHLAGPFGDCTSSYSVEFPENITVEQFISYVIQENPKEWGCIRLNRGFKSPNLAEYDYGVIKYTQEYEQYKTKKVIKAKAYGGWSLMDYSLDLEGDPKLYR